MKRIIYAVIALVLLLSLFGCGAGYYTNGISKFDNFNGTSNPTNYLNNDLVPNYPVRNRAW